MRRRRRRSIDLARIGFGVSNELRNRFGRKRWIDHHDVGNAHDSRDRREVADEIEIKFFIECRVDRARGRDKENRVAIGRRIDNGLGGEVGGRTWPVFDNERLSKVIGQPLAHQARGDVVAAAVKQTRRSTVPAGSDSPLRVRLAIPPTARQRPLLGAENFDGEVS